MSVNIKDAEEKKLVIGYIKNIHRKKKNPFTIYLSIPNPPSLLQISSRDWALLCY